MKAVGIIIDSNMFSTFIDKKNEDAKPIHKCILKKTLQLVYGGDDDSMREIKKHDKMKRELSRLRRLNSAIKVNKGQLEKEKKKLDVSKLRSNDQHLICIALVRRDSRLLFSKDKNLHQDFKNKYIINNPEGKIYQSKKDHIHLLP